MSPFLRPLSLAAVLLLSVPALAGVVPASADMSVVKTLDTPGPYVMGQTIQYTLVIANAGPDTATTITVQETPSNLTITGASGACVTVPCIIPSLAPAASTNITITATINSAAPFDNIAAVNALESDPDPADNTDDTGNGGTATAGADLLLVKNLITPGPYAAGQSITYSLFVANGGPATATNVLITDTPTNLTITSVSGGVCTALPCTIPSLAPNGIENMAVTATINSAGPFDNAATASADQPDPDPTSNTDNLGNGGVAAAGADVSIVKTLTTAGPYSAGQSVTYTLDVANAGPSPATSVAVTDAPANLIVTSVSGGGCAALPCTIPSLAAGAGVTITLTATIDVPGPFDNAAAVDADEPDPDPADNGDATGNGGVAGVPLGGDLELTKTASTAALTPGETFDYILTVENHGPVTANNVVVSDPLPAGFTFISATPTQGTCDIVATTVTCIVGTMSNGATATITIRGTASTASLTNTATVDSATETDPNPANNTDTLALGPEAAGIPTVGEYGLLVMATLLALGGVWVMRIR